MVDRRWRPSSHRPIASWLARRACVPKLLLLLAGCTPLLAAEHNASRLLRLQCRASRRAPASTSRLITVLQFKFGCCTECMIQSGGCLLGAGSHSSECSPAWVRPARTNVQHC